MPARDAGAFPHLPHRSKIPSTRTTHPHTRRPFPPFAAEDTEGNESAQHNGAEARAHVCRHLFRADALPIGITSALLAHLKRFIKSAYPDDKKLFVYHLKASTQRVSVALRRATSDAVLVFNQVAKAYPAVPLGGVAAAPLEGAAEAAEGDDAEEDEEAE